MIESDNTDTIDAKDNKIEFVATITHKLTHIDMIISLWTITKVESQFFSELYPEKGKFTWISWKNETNYGFPKAIKKLLDLVRPNIHNLF